MYVCVYDLKITRALLLRSATTAGGGQQSNGRALAAKVADKMRVRATD